MHNPGNPHDFNRDFGNPRDLSRGSGSSSSDTMVRFMGF
jgi:hypothetical protein